MTETNYVNETELEKVESQAQQVVHTIKACIDEIRSIKAFHPISVKTAMKLSGPTGVGRPIAMKGLDNDKGPVYLFRLLEEKGLLKQVQDTCYDSTPKVDDMLIITADNTSHPLDADRRRFIYKICLPLLDTLSSLFKSLDEAAPSPTSKPTQESESNHSKGDGNNRSRMRKKPDAPRGLLSLSNYTDIACLLELTVCTSVIPLLERHVHTPIKDRIGNLPKSLAGRLHRKCLHWGTDTLQHQPSIIGGTVVTRQNRAAMKIDAAAQELSDATVTVCKVLFLDRFRPMLLPRHATDVYSALFQLERLLDLRDNFNSDILRCFNLSDNSSELMTVRSMFLHSADEKGKSKDKSSTLGLQCIDYNTMVLSYQGLLSSGKHAPTWLKSKISNQLTGLPSSSWEGLKAIIDVFVVAASSLPTEQMTGASSRLGRVLCVKSIRTNDDSALEYYNNMFDQLMDLLVFKEHNFTDESSATDNSVVAGVLTTWAILDNLPTELVRRFFRRLIDGLVPSSTPETVTCNSLKLSVRRIHSLLLFPPNSGKAVDEFCLCLLSDVDTEYTKSLEAPGHVSAMGQLIRIATASGDQVLHSDIIAETKNTINLIVYAALLKWNFGIGENISSEQYLAVSLTRAIINNPIDMLGYRFLRNADEISFQWVDDSSSSSLLLDMERRATFLVTDIVVRRDALDQEKGDHTTVHESNVKLFRRMECLASTFFKLQLLVYFQASSSEENTSLPNSIVQHIDNYKIMAMLFLPLLCEKCSPGTLLAENDDSSSREVMYIMRLVIRSTSRYFGQEEDNQLSSQVKPEPCQHSIYFVKYDSIAKPFSSTLSVAKARTIKDISVTPAIESQLSILSIVLSILITILELGSSKRTDEEETELILLVPHLSTLSILTDRPSSSYGSSKNISMVLQTEIAEMASHAMVLIQARSLKELPRDNTVRHDLTLHEYLSSQLKEIELNLASDQPPLRAYAVSKLRKLAIGTIERLKDSEKLSSANHIVEIKVEDNPSSLLYLANKMLRVCISTLDDKESYVYLASIQTIVSMTDQLPEHFMPVIIHAVTSGKINLCDDETTMSEINILSATQRVKLAEAMNFIIRRRGPAVQNYSNSLMNSILHGHNTIGNTAIIQDSQTQGMIQSQTESYFRGVENSSADSPNLNEESPGEGNIRLMTGGPIFDMEENDIIRSACISMLTELLSILHPSSVAPHCATLVQFATNALILDHSRLVRRASALLGRELYLCASREFEESNGAKPLVSSTDYIMSLLSNGEDALFTALQRAVKSNDVDFKVVSTLLPAVSGKTRLYDSATIARCKEAIACRHELEEEGIILAAGIILKAQKDHDRSSIAALISREIGGVTKAVKFDLSQ